MTRVCCLVLLLISLISVQDVNAQNRTKTTKHRGNTSIVIPEGPFIGYHNYTLQLDSSRSYYVTFNKYPIPSSGRSKFVISSMTRGELCIYDVTAGDTALMKKAELVFRNPEFDVQIRGKSAGSKINRDAFNINTLYVTVLHNEIDERLLIVKGFVSFYHEGVLKKELVADNGRLLPFSQDVQNLPAGTILVFDITIDALGQQVVLPPAVFYLQ